MNNIQNIKILKLNFKKMSRKNQNSELIILSIIIGISILYTLGETGIFLFIFILAITVLIYFIKFAVGLGAIFKKDSSYSVNFNVELDDILEDKIKIGESSVEYLKKGGIKKITIPVYFPELNLSKDVSAKSASELKEKIESVVTKWADKYKAHLERIELQDKKQAFQEFNLNTIRIYNIGVSNSKLKNPGNVSFDLSDEVKIVEIENPHFFQTSSTITIQNLTNFIMSGKFNSILGVDGLNAFKSELLSLIESVGKTSLKQSDLKEIIFKTGIHYEYDSAPESLKKYDDETKWKAFLRQVLVYSEIKTLSDIDVKKLKEMHYKIFDDFSDLDKENLERIINDTSAYLFSDMSAYFNKLNEKLTA